MVIDRSELERQGDWSLEVLEKTSHVGLNFIKTVDFLVVSHEHITIYFVNENFVNNVLFQFASLLYKIPKTHTRAFIILFLGIYHINQRSTVLDLVSLLIL